jgi:hypothetical protein
MLGAPISYAKALLLFETKTPMKKTVGWLLVVLGALWGVIILIRAHPNASDSFGTGQLIGAVLLPTLVIVVGFYLAGIIQKAK